MEKTQVSLVPAPQIRTRNLSECGGLENNALTYVLECKVRHNKVAARYNNHCNNLHFCGLFPS